MVSQIHSFNSFLSLLFGLFIATSAARHVKPAADFQSPPPTNQGPIPACHAPSFANLGLDMSDFLYCDASLPFEVRAKDLVDRMTLDEKVQQLGNTATGVSRIGLPKYEWWSEALHGVSNVGPGTFFDETIPAATSFPTVILTTAAFNQSLWKSIGQAVSNEARAMYNLGKAGLTYWSPNINVVRDPRWGRATETPGEDPYVVGVYATNYVRGLQDVEGTENVTNLNARPLKVSSCCKHYAAYDVDNWMGVDRYHFDARVAEQDMTETFLKPFEMCVKDGDVSSVMCSYNRINGIPACADPNLLKDKIRGEWDLHGYIVSDCDSIEVMLDNAKWLSDKPEDAVAQTLKAGLDLDCGNYYPSSLGNSVRQGSVSEAALDKSLNYLYVVLMRLGFFDGTNCYNNLGEKDVCSDANIELATEAAREGIVLLKNDDNLLPLKSMDIKKLAIVGPHANATTAMIGNYAGIPCRFVSPLDAFSKYGEVTYEVGCGELACPDKSMIFPAMEAAKNADATILFVGLDLSIEAESNDRVDLLLPGYQTELIRQVAEASTGPLVLVIMSAGGVDINFAKKNNKVKSIIWAGYPGEEGGTAIADVVFGKYNPGGRLPLTWYESNYVNMIPMGSMPLRPVDSLGYPGRTYKFFNGSTVYPFGYGLSYTDFTYTLTTPPKSLRVQLNKFQQCRNVNYSNNNANPNSCPSVVIDNLKCGYQFGFEVSVQNVGDKDGSDVVLVYSKAPQGIIGTHAKQLVGFQRIFVKAGATKKVKFELDACKSLNIVDSSGYNILPSGSHIIMVGNDVMSFPIDVCFN